MVWRLAVVVIGFALLLNGSLRAEDDAWPFGPMSQYAFSPKAGDRIKITRVEGVLADGRRIDLPLRIGTAGIARADIEAGIPKITQDPSILSVVDEGWSARHPDEPPVRQVWLVQDVTVLTEGGRGETRLEELATWVVPR